MCGISGFISKQGYVTSENIKKMNRAIKHRGPDDEGYCCIINDCLIQYAGEDTDLEIKKKYSEVIGDEKVSAAFGFRRLSIIDLSVNGHQPMIANQVLITFNGEIYNYRELKNVLQQKGFQFNSSSDTEVILNAYIAWGVDMVQYLEGMFAIVIHDAEKKETYLIRDRLGIKPLFYHVCDNAISWCSEIKGLLALDWVYTEMNMQGLIANYQFITTPSPDTCFKNIYSLPPASIMTINKDGFYTHQKYWDYPIGSVSKNYTEAQASDLITAKLMEVVTKQLNADVPVITMMSGGIDSTFLTSIAHKVNPHLSCYTLSIDGTGKGTDELPQARKMAEMIGIEQYIHSINDDEIVEECIADMEHFEEPYNNLDVIFNASKYLSNKGYKVVLSGNGADEVFGGYGYNLKLKSWRRKQKFSLLASIIPELNLTLQKVKYHLEVDSVGAFFMSSTGGMRRYSINELLPHYGKKNISDELKTYLKRNDFDSDYKGLFYYDLKYSVGSHHVYHDDLCAMRYSVEMRYPYLDHKLIELAASMPLLVRYNGKVTKPLLRAAAKKYITNENLSMSKKGFGLPLTRLIMNNKRMSDFVHYHINELKQSNLFDKSAIDKIVSHGFGTQSFLYVWQLVSTSVWLRKYFNY